MDPEVPGSSPGGGTIQGRRSALLSAHARYAAYTAAECGFAFRSLDGDDGYLFEVRDGARKAAFAAGQGSPYALNDANAASIARDKAFCAEVLGVAGLPVLPGQVFFVTSQWAEMRAPGRELQDARAFAGEAAFPIFCKPIAASNGLYAEVIDDAAAFDAYMARVAREHFAILAQPYMRGDEYRVFVLDGRVVFSYRKRPPECIGDGVRSLAQLAGREGVRGRVAGGALLQANDVPEHGALVVLQGPANRAAGGRFDAFQDGAPRPLEELCVAAARAVGLRLAGVDVFDLSTARDLSDLTIIEVNSNPMIATLEELGRWDLIAQIWRANFAAALR